MTLKLMAAIPSHSGSIVVECASTLLAAQRIAAGRGGSFEFHYQSGATISLVRNAIVAEFLQSEADLLLMIDADQGIEPETIERMIDFNRPLVGVMSPKRRYNWSQVRLPAAAADPALIPAQALEFAGVLEADRSGDVSVTDGFARAEHVGAGVLLVRREVFEQLMSRFPELEGRGFGRDAYPDLERNWGFFNPIDTEDGVPLSEDLSFCERWRAAGGEIWVDVVGAVTHVGLHRFRGSYAESWRAHRSG